MVSPVAEAFLCEDLDSPLIAEKGDVYGEGVNVAARLQAYAEPGDVIVSQVVAEKLQPQARTGAIDLGELPLRNMQKPVRVYALRPDPAAASPQRLGEAGADEEARPRSHSFPSARITVTANPTMSRSVWSTPSRTVFPASRTCS